MKGKKISKGKLECESKENIYTNGHSASSFTKPSQGERRGNKKQIGPLADITSFSKTPQEMRSMTRAQETIIYNEFSHGNHLHHEFYDLVEEKLGNSKISAKIRQIRNMSNEEAIE